jgi:hypothetical protein
MTAPGLEFEAAFHALTDRSPFGWQRRLFEGSVLEASREAHRRNGDRPAV